MSIIFNNPDVFGLFRITGLVEKLCTNYGKKICEEDGVSYYSFPEVQALAPDEVLTF